MLKAMNMNMKPAVEQNPDARRDPHYEPDPWHDLFAQLVNTLRGTWRMT
jgi:hypothetical protein